LLGQGATEYLVLLAVVLIVALVSVALLGFFPGMASDAQRQQSEMYWRSASPIAITEWAAKATTDDSTRPYIRLRNTGTYPIRITGIIGPDGNKATTFYGIDCGVSPPAFVNISDYYYMGPGEEKYFSAHGAAWYGAGAPCDSRIYISLGRGSGNRNVGIPSSVCQQSASNPGTLQLSSFGFEYMEYIDGQQITKRQIGKQVIIKCLPPG